MHETKDLLFEIEKHSFGKCLCKYKGLCCSVIVILRCGLCPSISLLFLLLVLPRSNKFLILPNAAGVVFGACDDRVAFIIEGTSEYLIFVTLARIRTEALQLIASLCRPDAARLVATCGHYLIALRVE